MNNVSPDSMRPRPPMRPPRMLVDMSMPSVIQAMPLDWV